jgi:hypothetical protein
MGRYLSNGIPTKIRVILKSYNKIEKNDLTEIKKDLSKYVDLSKYELVECENGYIFEFKKEVFNKHICELIKELEPLTSCRSYFMYKLLDKYDINVLSDEFNKDNYKIELCKYGDNPEYEKENYISENEYYVRCQNNHIGETGNFPYQYWVLSREIRKKYYIDMSFIMLWSDYNKFSGEDSTPMLEVLNSMKSSYYKSPLSKSLIYFMAG